MDIIKGKKVNLIQWLRGEPLILQHVQGKNLITMHEYERVNSVQDSTGKVTQLLDLILRKGDQACKDFLHLLQEAEVNESMPELRCWIATVNSERPVVSPVYPGSNMSSSTSQANIYGIEDCKLFLKNNRKALIQNITNVMEIVDGLSNLTDGQKSNIEAKSTSQDKMRMVLDYTKSQIAAQSLVEALFEHAEDVMEELPKA